MHFEAHRSAGSNLSCMHRQGVYVEHT
jgi:hypothetical protein